MMATGPVDALPLVPAVAPVEIPNGPKAHDPRRRTRIEPGVDPELRSWLQRAARAHSHVAAIVRLYGTPSKAGGTSLLGEGYAERVARGDRTLLYDAVTYCRDELDGIRQDIWRRMEAAPPTHHPPGSKGKVEVLAERMYRGDSLFLDGDAKK